MTAAASSSRRERLFLALFLGACAVALNLQQMVDPDLFWHLRGGRDIWQAGWPVLPDTWNYLFQGRVWVNQQWLTELIMDRAFALGGFGGLMALRTLVGLGTVAFLLGALKGRPRVARYLSVAVFVACNAKFFLFRTHTFSFLMMAALLFVMERVSGWRRLPWLVCLFALWANLHAFFGLGLLVVGLYTVAEWWTGARRFSPSALLRTGLVPACAAATFLNPFGWRVWETALATLGHQESYLVTEWWPVWRYPISANAPFYALVLLLVALLLFRPRAPRPPHLLSAGALLVMGVRSVRLTSAFTLPAMPLLADLLAALLPDEEARGEGRLAPLKPVLVALLIGWCALGGSWIVAHPITVPTEIPRQDYPQGAVTYMREHGLKGRVFNEFDLGGYLVWALPGCQTVIDGRTGVLLFPWGHMTAWRKTVDVEEGWRERLEQGNPDFVLLYADDYLSQQLRTDPGWRLLHEDHLSVLFGRDPGRK